MKDKHQILKVKDMSKIEILRVLVGSRAHGIAKEDADYDYRGVHLIPTSELVGREFKYKGIHWVEGEEEDQTSYELKEFINLAIQGHPNILEMFVTPVIESNEDGQELLKLFPYIWCPKKAHSAFRNYANNRRKNMFNAENKDVAIKSGYCAVRVLINLIALLKNNNFSLNIPTEHLQRLIDIKEGRWTEGEIIDYISILETESNYALETNKHVPNLLKVEEFYIKLRKKYWE